MDSLGGYRLVRRLGVGVSSDVWLGSDGSETVAVKVFRKDAERNRIDAEIEALGRASSRHLVRLEDLAMGPHGIPCLILQRLTQWSLGRVLAVSRPSAGEAVTILAPLCLAVAELHRVGVAHGRVRGGSVLFDNAGAPVLASFGDAQLFGPMPEEESSFSVPPAQLAHQPDVAKDVDDLAALSRCLVEPDGEIAQWIALAGPREPSTFARDLADRLFQLAAPEPVRFDCGATREPSPSVPLRIAGSAQSEPIAETSSTRNTVESHAAALFHIQDGFADRVFEWCGRALERSHVSDLMRRVKNALRPVRTPVWIMAGIVAAGVVAATALMPAGGHQEANRNPAPEPSTVPTISSPTAAFRADLTGDDPVAAAAALLEARAECFRVRSVLCLDSVDQRGAAAMESDAVQLRLLQDGGADSGAAPATAWLADTSGTAWRIAVVERLGDSALVSVSTDEPDLPGASLSLLLIKLEEGWRIRDIIPLSDSPA